MSTRDFSDPQEEFIRASFQSVGVEMPTRDRSSGSARNDGDGMSEAFFLSCKFRSNKSFTLTHTDYEKDIKQAAAWSKVPIWALRNQHGEDVIMLRLKDFLNLLR